MKKISRTISGVAPVAVMARPMGCPGQCVYCPNDPTVPRSYTSESPAVLRGLRCDFDGRKQVEERLRILQAMGHPTDKVELIIMGGTFPATPIEYQYWFVQGCYDGLNGVGSATLDEAKLQNETTTHRCVGLCIETRPDWCNPEVIARMLDFGTTRVELGVQTLDDSIYNLVKRGHAVKDVVKATALLKKYGFKVHYHWMPGLPGSNVKHDLELSSQLFTDPDLRPDGLKLYPTLVVQGTELDNWYHDGRYRPYGMDELVQLLAQIKNMIPEYVRVSRLMRDIPAQFIVAGCRDGALRDAVKRHMIEMGVQCRCIRCREYGHRFKEGWPAGEPSLHRLDYDSAGGKEVFLSFKDDQETLFGLLRMRVPHQPCPPGNGDGAAMIRELHVFGPQVPLRRQQASAAQHKGFGKALLKEAERIAAREFSQSKLTVLSGVGAREYYRSEFGYVAKGPYMVKVLNP